MATISIAASLTHTARQELIYSAAPGDTVVFEAGNHLQAGNEFLVFIGDPTNTTTITYTGLGVIQKTSSVGQHSEPCVKLRGGASGSGGTRAHRVTINGLTFLRGGVQARGGAFENLVIWHCVFREIRSGIGLNGSGRCIESTGGTISLWYNTFENCLHQLNYDFGQAVCIYLQSITSGDVRLNMANLVQTFLQVRQDELAGNPASGALIIRDNMVDGLTATGIELSGSTGSAVHSTGTQISYNTVKNWITQAHDKENWDQAYGIHVSATSAAELTIRSNTILGPGKVGYDGHGVRAGLKINGKDCNVFLNTVQNCAVGVMIGSGSGAAVYNNTVCGASKVWFVLNGTHPGLIVDKNRSDESYPNIIEGSCGASDVPYLVPEPLGVYTFVTDLTTSWIDVVNGLGPIGIDQSNGTDAAGDGREIQLKLGRYPRGIGGHAYSRVRVPLPPSTYTRFQATVGVDDEIVDEGGAGKGTVQFRVTADGQELYLSPVMRQGNDPREIDVDITGRGMLTLEILGGADEQYNRGSWGYARLLRQIDAPSGPKVRSYVHDADQGLLTLNFVDQTTVTYPVE